MSERRREVGATDTNWDINDPDIPARIDLHVSFFTVTIVAIVTINDPDIPAMIDLHVSFFTVTIVTIVTINDPDIPARIDLHMSSHNCHNREQHRSHLLYLCNHLP